MTFEEANKNSNDLICRNNLSYDETEKRLKNYFTEKEVSNIMHDVDAVVSWTDGKIVVICTDKVRKKYSIITSGYYIDLIRP